jgi:hypothetical protein
MFQQQTNTSHARGDAMSQVILNGQRVKLMVVVTITKHLKDKDMMDYLEELADTPTLSEDMGEIDVILMEEL